jgi:GntR family transcriptional regulator
MSELGDNRTGPLSPASQNLQLDVDLDRASLYHWFNTVVQRGSQMQIHIQTQGGVPIYVQVMQQIKYLVASGRLQPGDELPSIRTLAEQLIVNPNTIARAYRELESAGVVEKRRTAGTYVAETGSPLARKERLKLLNQRIDQLLVEAFQMGFELDEVLKLVQQSQLNSQQTKKGQPRHE